MIIKNIDGQYRYRGTRQIPHAPMKPATSGNIRQHPATSGNIRQHPATSGNIRQHPATSGNIRQHPEYTIFPTLY